MDGWEARARVIQSFRILTREQAQNSANAMRVVSVIFTLFAVAHVAVYADDVASDVAAVDAAIQEATQKAEAEQLQREETQRQADQAAAAREAEKNRQAALQREQEEKAAVAKAAEAAAETERAAAEERAASEERAAAERVAAEKHAAAERAAEEKAAAEKAAAERVAADQAAQQRQQQDDQIAQQRQEHEEQAALQRQQQEESAARVREAAAKQAAADEAAAAEAAVKAEEAEKARKARKVKKMAAKKKKAEEERAAMEAKRTDEAASAKAAAEESALKKAAAAKKEAKKRADAEAKAVQEAAANEARARAAAVARALEQVKLAKEQHPCSVPTSSQQSACHHFAHCNVEKELSVDPAERAATLAGDHLDALFSCTCFDGHYDAADEGDAPEGTKCVCSVLFAVARGGAVRPAAAASRDAQCLARALQRRRADDSLTLARERLALPDFISFVCFPSSSVCSFISFVCPAHSLDIITFDSARAGRMCTAIDKCDASLYPGAVAGHGLCGDGASCIVTGPGTYQCSVLRFWVVEHGRGFAMLAALWLICLAGFGLLERIPRAFVGFLTVRRAQCAALEARAPRKATTGRRESPPALSLLLFISFVCH